MVSRILLFACLVLVGCNGQKKLSKNEMNDIVHANNKLLEEAFLKADTDALLIMYDEDAKLSPDGDKFYRGKAEIGKFWSENIKIGKLLKMTTNTLSVDGNADVIYETGITSTETLYQDSVYKTKVKFVNVWKRQPDDTYKLSIDFWNDAEKVN